MVAKGKSKTLRRTLACCGGFWLLAVAAALMPALTVFAQEVPVKADPLVRMPGSQPAPEGNVGLEAPNRCLNCHAGYNPAVEPGFNWQGSMMAHAMRDFLFFSCLTVAAQDSIWAIGRPNATDLCIRCHSPKGWLEGRSDPTNASALVGADYDGVQCDFCHRMYDPFFETTFNGTREGADWLGYWDETNAGSNPSAAAALTTHSQDASQAQAIRLFNGNAFYSGNLPHSVGWDENAGGQYFVSSDAARRASFADAAARHQMLYSRYHKSKFFCAACHDVSNPILANLDFAGTPPGDGVTVLPSEVSSGYSFFHVERTFSEFMLSDYAQPGGAPGLGPFAPEIFETSYANNYVAKCQDCHMRDVVGKACNKQGVPIRPDDSVEHPQSGQPLHDLTGGNVWVSWVLASAVVGSPNYDAINDGLLNQGPAVLTLDLGQGLGIDPTALLAGVDRARQQLQLAAAIEQLTYDANTGALSLRIQNHTGHKLISGFPEGRRMFVNVKAYAGGQLIWEVNPYDGAAGTLKGLACNYQPDPNGVLPPPAGLGANEAYVDELVYEMHPSSSLTGEDESFHFALADNRYKDNRIPPKGFRTAEMAGRLVQPRWHGVDDPGYFSTAEYAGGYDDVSLTIAAGADVVEVGLYYQTTSREYVEFLRDEINANPANLTLPASAYVIATDPFFDRLRAWGDTIWDLWSHNMNADGAAPFLMARATVGGGGGCGAPVPTLLSAVPGNGEVTLTWSDEHSADPAVVGYGVYYDQAGKAQLIAQVAQVTTYLDTGLTNGQEYCYALTARYADCESVLSNVLCATPNPQGQLRAGVQTLETGTVKKGTFTPATTFNVGDTVHFRAHVVDAATGLPLANATVEITISGPEPGVLITAPSDADGLATAQWKTQPPKGKNPGTTPGAYTGTVTDVTAAGYTWDGVRTWADFTLR